MAAADDLWTAVKADYDSAGLVALTRIRDSSATTISDSVGTAAAQAVINLWPAYAQIAYDPTNALHIAAAELGVIAMLWRRGGASSTIEQVKWDEVFGDAGVITRVKQVGARGHAAPKSNSGVQQKAEQGSDGRPVRGWSDRESLPTGFLSNRTSSADGS